MDLKNGTRRELLIVGGVLFAGTLILFWFLTNIYFDRWTTGTFAPTPFLPYPVVPHSNSFNSGHWTGLFYLYLIIGLPLAVAFIGELFYVAWKYRDHPGRKLAESPETISPGKVPRSHAKPRSMLYLNIFVAVILFSLTAYSLPLNSEMLGSGPANQKNLTIEVYAFQWGWKFVYPNNHSSIDAVTLPVNEDIVFKVTSTDVMHDFAIPALSVKVDAYPGHWNSAWTDIYNTGNYTVFCMELCGVGHADMVANLNAVPSAEFASWYAQTSPS